MIHRCALLLTVISLMCLPTTACAQSRRGELRGAWMGSGYGRDWDAIVSQLSDNGFNALFPNFSTGAVAYYPSGILPPADPSHTGDELAAVVRAARAHGMEVHVWRINWALFGASEEQLAELEAAGRLQRNPEGRLAREDAAVGVDWLCPSHPENRKLEKEAMLELVRRYDIAGVQFDYMRFPSASYCFCDTCKDRFQGDAGVTVEEWPADVREGGRLADEWERWRRQLLTGIAIEIANEIHAADPDCFVSLASWPHTDGGRHLLGQDWPEWLRAGALDFVCPMVYTNDDEEFAELLRDHIAIVRGAVPVYVGMAAFRMSSAWQLIDQIELARQAGADGFVAFAYGTGDLGEWLPHLHSSVASVAPDPMPHRGPPAAIEFAGAAAEPPAHDNRLIAGEQAEVGFALGWQPPAETEAEGAPEAGAMLDRMLDPRTPVRSYEERPGVGADLSDRPRLSGRIVAEDPQGISLRVLGAFETDYQFAKTLRFTVPEGLFRVAVYGRATTPEGERDFVVRGPLLMGASRQELEADALRSRLNDIFAGACERPEVSASRDISGAFRIEATGPAGGTWWMRLSEGECEAGKGEIENPDVTFRASAEDWLALARKEVDPRMLWESGRLSASGDEELLRQLIGVYRGRAGAPPQPGRAR